MKNNPFLFDRAVERSDAAYFRRGDLAQDAVNSLLVGHYVTLLGPRVCGMTSLILETLRTAQDCDDNCRCLYIDLEAVRDDTDQVGVFQAALAASRWVSQATERVHTHADDGAAFRRALRSIVRGKPIKLVVGLDHLDSDRLRPEFVTALARCVRVLYNERQTDPESSKVSILIGGSQGPYSLSTGAGSPLNVAERYWVHDFIPEQVGALVRAGAQACQMLFEDSAIAEIAAATGGDAYFVQVVCHECVEQAHAAGTRTVTADMVREAFDRTAGLDYTENRCFALLIQNLRREPDLTRIVVGLLDGERVIATEWCDSVDAVRLSGLLRADDRGVCAFRNAVYERFLRRQQTMLRHLWEVEARARQLMDLHGVTLEVASMFDPASALKEAAQAALWAISANVAAIYLHDKIADRFRLGGEVASTEEFQAPHTLVQDEVARRVVATRRSVLIADCASCSGCELSCGLCSCVWLALRAGDDVLGTLVVASDKSDHFDKSTVRAAEILAGHLSSAVARTKLVGALQTVGGVAIASASKEQILSQIAGLACDLLNVPVALIWELDPDTATLRVVAYSGNVAQGYAECFRLQASREPVRSFLERHEPVFLEDVQETVDFQGRAAVGKMGWRSLLTMPLRTRAQAIGIIEVYTFERWQATPSHRALLKLLANQAAMTIDNADLFLRQRRERSALGSLYQVASACRASLDSQEILDVAMGTLQARFGLAACTVGLLEDGDEYLECVSYGGREEPRSVRIGELPQDIRHALETEENCILCDVSARPDLAAQFGWHDVTSVALLPLLSSDRLVGVLAMGHTAALHLDDSDRAFVTALVDELTVGIANARLHEQTRRAQEELELCLIGLVHGLHAGPDVAAGCVETLLADKLGPVNDEQRECLDEAWHSLEDHYGLLENVNMYGRLKGGRVQPRREVVSLSDVVGKLVDSRRQRARAQGIKLRARGLGALPPLETDKDLLRMVVGNILDNAIKFSPQQGRVRIEARVGPDAVRIVVDDTGPGLPVGQGKDVFDELRPRELTSARTQQGMGFGLAIAWRLAARLGGQLASLPKRGPGARIAITLPRDASMSSHSDEQEETDVDATGH